MAQTQQGCRAAPVQPAVHSCCMAQLVCSQRTKRCSLPGVQLAPAWCCRLLRKELLDEPCLLRRGLAWRRRLPRYSCIHQVRLAVCLACGTRAAWNGALSRGTRRPGPSLVRRAVPGGGA